MNVPRISVVMPVYNAAPWLEAAVHSILRQTCRDFEFIAVDDGSTDGSGALLGRLAARDPRLRVVSRPNTGIVGALNDGLRLARGDYIARMDADDIALPERFDRQSDYLGGHPDCVAVGSAFIYMDARGALLKWNPRPLAHAEIEARLLLGDGGAIIHPAVMMRRSAVESAGGYRESAQWIEDLDLYLRLARIGTLANLPEVLLHYRYHEQSVNFTRNAGRSERKLAVLAEAHAARGLAFDAAACRSAPHPERIDADAARDFALTSLRFADRRTPWRYALRALLREPASRATWKTVSYLAKVSLGFIARPQAGPASVPRLLYIGQVPAEGTGSPVIVLRHLQRLSAAGWKITVVAEEGQETGTCRSAGWTVAHLPHRRAWWPPFRRDIALSRRVRTSLLGRECRRLTAGSPPDAVLGYLAAHSDFSAEIAARFARQSGVPLSLLIHDDAAAFAPDSAGKTRLRRRHAWILKQARRCWFVSPELAAAYDVPDTARRILPPIPEGRAETAVWQARRAKPRVVYAGHIWAPQFPLLGKIARVLDSAGARLTLLSRATDDLATFLATGVPADHLAPFPSNREALDYLVENADGILVSYTETVAEMPWIGTSFPSKLVEYTHLGLPCAIVAPAESSVGRWAARTAWSEFYLPDELGRVGEWAWELRQEPVWRQRREASLALARGEFSPEKIQASFAAGLLRT
ncbi:glycosyl transferase family 2 [Opitutaceae bacterium TAV5]|nr:glycosyl transferase family 2 [Opitutaceae bacterium TAV5]